MTQDFSRENQGARVSFFETAHCTTRLHCFTCRNHREFRETMAQKYLVPGVDFDCPHGITKENLVKPSFFESELCKSRQHCKTCRMDKSFREAVAQRFDVPDAEFRCPLGIIEDNFKDGKFPSLVQEAMNLAKSVATVVKDAAQGKAVTVSEEELQRRYSICEKCDLFDADKKRCRKCGCWMDMKSKLASMECEIGKW